MGCFQQACPFIAHILAESDDFRGGASTEFPMLGKDAGCHSIYWRARCCWDLLLPVVLQSTTGTIPLTHIWRLCSTCSPHLYGSYVSSTAPARFFSGWSNRPQKPHSLTHNSANPPYPSMEYSMPRAIAIFGNMGFIMSIKRSVVKEKRSVDRGYDCPASSDSVLVARTPSIAESMFASPGTSAENSDGTAHEALVHVIFKSPPEL